MTACPGDCGACEPCHEERHGACASSACPCCGRRICQTPTEALEDMLLYGHYFAGNALLGEADPS